MFQTSARRLKKMVQTLWEMTSACCLPSPKLRYCLGWVGLHPLGKTGVRSAARSCSGRLTGGCTAAGGQARTTPTRPRSLRTHRCAPRGRAPPSSTRAPLAQLRSVDPRAPDAVLRWRAQPRRRRRRRRGPSLADTPPTPRALPPPAGAKSRPPARVRARASPRPLLGSQRPGVRLRRLRGPGRVGVALGSERRPQSGRRGGLLCGRSLRRSSARLLIDSPPRASSASPGDGRPGSAAG